MLKIYDPYLYAGKFNTSTRRGKAEVQGNTVYVSIDNFRNYANYQKFFAFKHDGNTPTNNQPVTTNGYTRYVNAKIGLNIRNAPNGAIIGSYRYGTVVIVYESIGSWSRTDRGWVCSDYLTSYLVSQETSSYTIHSSSYRIGKYRVNASVLNVRYGAGTNYKAKTWRQLTANARSQNKRLGNYYTNGLKRGVITTVTKVIGEWGLTPSGYVNLRYCTKL